MNLQLTSQSVHLHQAYTQIDRNRGFDTRHVLGRCVARYLIINGNGATTDCKNVVHAGEGYADLDGEPFKAYYCAKCARERGAE